ncbi:MAG: helix-turn-helix transcriptional regulator [Rhodospirillaceae bacterium]|nr:helix-turn-helix transcriptional regulator [Rhodospirillales bacterium]
MAGKITIEQTEYDALVGRVSALERELDARDAARLDEAAADAEAGDYLPLALVKRILAGEHPVKVWREHRGMAPLALADKSGVARSYIAEIEAGKKPGSVAAYRRLADAFGLTVDDLLPAETDDSALH